MNDFHVPILRPPPDLTHDTIPALDQRLAPYADTATCLVIDLSEVDFITSAGLGRLVHIGQAFGARDAPVVLAGGRRRVVKLIRTVGLHEVMPHFPDVADAVAWLRARSE